MEYGVNMNDPIYKDIPQNIIYGIERYVDHRCRPGSFLTAVLSNDLFTAVGKADPNSLKALKGILTFLFCSPGVSSDCWGSKEKVENWLKSI